MKICIPIVQDEGLASRVNPHFGSAPLMFVYDSAGKSHAVSHNANHEHEHGTSQPVAAIRGLNVDAVVCGGMGLRAAQILNPAGVKVYRSEHPTVAEIINDLILDSLSELTPQDACTEHHCG